MHPTEAFVVLGVFGVVAGFGWIVWVIATNIRISKVARWQGQTQADLVEKLAASQELVRFLETEGGQRLFKQSPPIEPRRNPVNRILGSVQAGVVLLVLGIVFAGLSAVLPLAEATFLALAATAGGIGVGLLLSALISYRLSRSMGLLDGEVDLRAP